MLPYARRRVADRHALVGGCTLEEPFAHFEHLFHDRYRVVGDFFQPLRREELSAVCEYDR